MIFAILCTMTNACSNLEELRLLFNGESGPLLVTDPAIILRDSRESPLLAKAIDIQDSETPAVVPTSSTDQATSILDMTVFEFWNDPYMVEMDTRYKTTGGLGGKTFVTFLSSIYHPQGGGQPGDRGKIIGKNSGAVFNVENAFVDESGNVIHHFGNFENDVQFNSNEEVTMKIDEDFRKICSQLHMAGHAMDYLVSKIAPSIKPIGGYTFPDSPYSEYQGDVDTKDKPRIIDELNEAFKKLIAEDTLRIQSFVLDRQAFQEKFAGSSIGGSSDVHRGLVRVIQYGDSDPELCSGTHYPVIRDMGAISVSKIEKKKGNLRIKFNTVARKE